MYWFDSFNFLLNCSTVLLYIVAIKYLVIVELCYRKHQYFNISNTTDISRFQPLLLNIVQLRSLESLDIFFKDLLGPSELRYDKVWPIYIYIKVFVLKVLMVISCSDLMINNWWLLEAMINICKQKNTMWIIASLHLFKSSDFSKDFLGPFELRDDKVWLYLYFV